MKPYAIDGTVDAIGEVKEFAKSKKQELTLAVKSGKFAEYIVFEFWNDTIEALSSVKVGNEIELEFYIGGRKGEGKWEGKTFNSLKGVNFSFKEGSAPVTQEVIDAGDEAQAADDAIPIDDSNLEILPF